MTSARSTGTQVASAEPIPAGATIGLVPALSSSSHSNVPRPVRGSTDVVNAPFDAVAWWLNDADRASPPSQCCAGSKLTGASGTDAAVALPQRATVTAPE